MKKYLQAKFVNFIISTLYKAVRVEDILTFEETAAGKKVYYRGEEVKGSKLDRLKTAANAFHKSDIWYLMRNDVRFAAQQKVLEANIEGTYDVIFGKAMIYNLEILEKIMEELE